MSGSKFNGWACGKVVLWPAPSIGLADHTRYSASSSTPASSWKKLVGVTGKGL